MLSPIAKANGPIIKAQELSLVVPALKAKKLSLKQNPIRMFGSFYHSRRVRSEVKLLDNISFELQSGDRLGLIGENGSGKTTLLRTLGGIYRPSSGDLSVNGTVRGFFDISFGMQPDATGLENIYLRGLQMGLGLTEIKSLVPGVVTFSGLDEHINDRLGNYSSGMRLRLAVAVSTMIEPDILLLDEWIGVGDAKFNVKVKERMTEIIEGSRGLVLATHNINLMKSLCNRALVIDKGRLVFQGTINDASNFYTNEILNKTR